MTHDERVYYHLYTKPENPSGNAELIASLEELVLHLHACIDHHETDDTLSCSLCPYDNDTWGCDFEGRMDELGVVE